MKALEKERTRRYATPDAFAADIARHLERRPVRACPPSRLYVLGKFVRRNQVGVMAGAGSNFLTPFGYQTNLMVYGPGRYRFLDFPRLGLPLLAIVIASATIMIPLVFPFR